MLSLDDSEQREHSAEHLLSTVLSVCDDKDVHFLCVKNYHLMDCHLAVFITVMLARRLVWTIISEVIQHGSLSVSQ